MDKNKGIKLIITGILIVILIFALNNAKKAVKKTQELRKKTLDSDVLADKRSLAEKGPADERPITATPGIGVSYEKLEASAEGQNLIRDPFDKVPVSVSVVSSSGELSLSGILLDKSEPMAVINNKIVSVGDKVGDNTVVEIKEDSVILYDGTQNIKLELGG